MAIEFLPLEEHLPIWILYRAKSEPDADFIIETEYFTSQGHAERRARELDNNDDYVVYVMELRPL